MRIRLLVFPFFFFLSILVVGQLTHPPYRQYTLRDGLSQMQVISLFQDSRGYIWAGTKEGLNCFNGEKIIRFTEKDGLLDEYIHQIAEDRYGNIWFSTRKGLACFDGQKVTSYPTKDQGSFYFAPTPDGRIWYSGENQQTKQIFGYFENGEYHDQLHLLHEVNIVGFLNINYSKSDHALLLDDSHNLYRLKNGEIKKLLSVHENLIVDQCDSTFLIIETDHKSCANLYEYEEGKPKLVANIKDGKLIGHNRASNEFCFFPNLDNNPLYILNPDTLITDVYPELHKSRFLRDLDQNIWVGTEEGLYQIFSGGFETYKRESLPTVWSIIEDLDKNIWFASYDSGLKKYDGHKLKAIAPDKHRLSTQNFYFQPSVDKRGTLHFPTSHGILSYKNGFFKNIHRNNCLTSFYDEKRDLLWGGYRFLTEIYDRNQKSIRTVGVDDGMEIKGYVVTIGKDKDGLYWLGGFTGLCRYNWDTKKLVNYNRANGRLPADGVMSNFNTPDGRTWFGSTHGLLYYDAKTDSIRKIDREEISGTVSFVAAIDSSWLVFSQSTGIYLMNLPKFNRSGEVELYFFNEKNGFLGIDPGQDGAMVDSKGNIWMTTSTEVVKLDPKKLDFKNYSVSVRISHFNGQRLPFDQKTISLPKNDRTAIVQFETICFNRPKSAQYSWKIEGSKHDWSPWQEEDYAVLTDLHDGEFQVQVKGRIPGLPNAEAVSMMPLVVNLAIWKQDWFFPTLLGLVSLLVLLSISMLYQTRMQMLKVNKQAKMFQLQAILSQMNPHFIFNVMASLQSMIVSANIEKANEYLVKMSNLVRGFLDASASTGLSKSKRLQESELPLKKELEILQNFIQFQQLIYTDRFSYQLVIDLGIDPMRQTIPPMLIQPFVENAIRHGLLQKTGNGLLQIRITQPKEKLLQIEIEDDGIGIKKAGELMRQSHLLYTSRGKELTMRRIKLLNEMGYRIMLDTQSSERGTIVTLKIPCHDKA